MWTPFAETVVAVAPYIGSKGSIVGSISKCLISLASTVRTSLLANFWPVLRFQGNVTHRGNSTCIHRILTNAISWSSTEWNKFIWVFVFSVFWKESVGIKYERVLKCLGVVTHRIEQYSDAWSFGNYFSACFKFDKNIIISHLIYKLNIEHTKFYVFRCMSSN